MINQTCVISIIHINLQNLSIAVWPVPFFPISFTTNAFASLSFISTHTRSRFPIPFQVAIAAVVWAATGKGAWSKKRSIPRSKTISWTTTVAVPAGITRATNAAEATEEGPPTDAAVTTQGTVPASSGPNSPQPTRMSCSEDPQNCRRGFCIKPLLVAHTVFKEVFFHTATCHITTVSKLLKEGLLWGQFLSKMF